MSKTLASYCFLKAAWRNPHKNYASFRLISTNTTALYSGDIVKTTSPDVDILNNHLKTASSTPAVLTIVKEHQKVMNNKHVMQALKTIWSLQKYERSISKANLVQHPDFLRLCKHLKLQAGVIETWDMVDALKMLSQLGVPSESTIIQVLLQLLRQNINSLGLNQIIFLHSVLKSFKSSPLVEALEIALPIVFEINLPVKLNRQHPEQMAECLFYAAKQRLSENVTDPIIQGLEDYRGEFSGDTAKSVIWSLCSLERNLRHEKLMNKCVTDLIVNIDSIRPIEMDITLSRLIHKYNKKFPFYYQEVLFDTCANYVIEHNGGLKRALDVLRNLSRVRHFHKPLINYVVALIHKDQTVQCNARDIYSIVVSLIISDYRPPHWESVKNWIRQTKDLGSRNFDEIIWIRFAGSLCLLDIYKIDVFAQALKKEYIHPLLKKGFLSDYENFFTIWQHITLYKPDLLDILPSGITPEHLVDKCVFQIEPTVGTALQSCLGAENFLLTKVYSKLGALIDYALVIGGDGCPVVLDQNIKFVEDLEVKADQQLVLVLSLEDYHYTINTNMLRQMTITLIKVLESHLNSSVIPINLNVWRELNDFEKIPYISEKIKSKLNCSNLGLSENLV